jgi:hypothetical protein
MQVVPQLQLMLLGPQEPLLEHVPPLEPDDELDELDELAGTLSLRQSSTLV